MHKQTNTMVVESTRWWRWRCFHGSKQLCRPHAVLLLWLLWMDWPHCHCCAKPQWPTASLQVHHHQIKSIALVSGPGCDLRVQPTGRLHTMISHAPRASIYGFLARIRFCHGTQTLASSLQARSTELTYSRYHTICSLIRLVFITIYLLPTTWPWPA